MNTHFFATYALGWACGTTRQEAIDNLINRDRDGWKRMAQNSIKDNQAGAYIWTCEVQAPLDEPYRIEFYTPKGVEWNDSKEHYVTRVVAKEYNYITKGDF